MTSQPEFIAKTDKPIFISYSRANHEYARNLYEQLEAIGFNIYRDLHDLTPGEDWWQQLKDAIEECETMVLCLSPEVLESEYVKREWHYARRVGTRVIPVVAAEVDFAEVPRWMKRVDWLDFRLEALDNDIAWKRFIQELNTPYRPRKVLHTAPEPPKNMVKRPDVFDPIIKSLVDEKEGVVALTAVLQGAGGYGKTTLAQAICDDPDVQGAFDDGILWVTLGENVTESDIEREILNLVYKLTGNRLDVQGVIAASDMLKDALEDKYILIVIDDVWKPEYLTSFLQGGKTCARLITTRYKRVLPDDETVKRHDIDQLQPAQALELIAQGFPPDEEIEGLQALAKRLGHWALLVKLANATLRGHVSRGMSLQDALTRVNKTLDAGDFTALKDAEHEQERNRAFAASFNVSLDTLIELEGDDAAQYFQQLAIFPEDIDIPLVILEKLWRLSEREIQDLCAVLDDLSLLTNYTLTEPASIRIHDVIRTHLRTENKKKLMAWHKTFLSHYELDSQWHELPKDEPYLWDNLIYHLLNSNQRNETLDLLLKSRQWMDAKFVATLGHQSYANDLSQVSETFQNSQSVETAKNLSLLWTARNILSQSAEAYNNYLLETLTYLGRTDEAFAQAQMRSNPASRFAGMLSVISTINTIEDAPYVGEYLNIMIDVARTIVNEGIRAASLSQIARVCAQAGQTQQAQMLMTEAVEVARTIAAEWSRAASLSQIARAYAQAGQFTEALDVARTIVNEGSRVASLSQIARAYAQTGQFTEAVEVARTIVNEGGRAASLSQIARAYAQAGQTQQAQMLMTEALDITRTMVDEEIRSDSLRQIANAYAQTGQFTEALEVARTITDEWSRADSLRQIANAYAQAGQTQQAQILMTEALDITRTMADEGSRVASLSQIARAYAQAGQAQQAQMLMTEALDVTHTIADEWSRVATLRQIANAYAQAGQAQQAQILMTEAVEVARAIADEGIRADSLSQIANAYAQAEQTQQAQILMTEALNVARAIADEWSRAVSLSQIASIYAQAGQTQQAQMLMVEAVEVAHTMADEGIRAVSLSQIANTYAQTGQFTEALKVARTIADEWSRAVSLRQIASVYAQTGQFTEAVEVARTIVNEGSRAASLSQIANAYAQTGQTQQAQMLMTEALDVVRAITDEGIRAASLSQIANAYTQTGQTQQAQMLMTEALDVAHTMADEGSRAVSLSQIASAYIQAGQFTEALDVTRTIAAEWSRAASLRQIASAYAQTGQFTEALKVARTIASEESRAVSLSQIANALIGVDVYQAYSILGIQGIDDYIQIASSWLNKLYPDDAPDIITEMMRIAGWHDPHWKRVYKILKPEDNSN